jgi:hypothetical protein
MICSDQKRRFTMSVGWIDNIYNNTAAAWYLKSVDDVHNGALSSSSGNFTLDDKNFHEIKANTHYHADWCGIPWYFNGIHYKVISKDTISGALFYTSLIGDKNCIVYEELNTGRQVILQAAPKDSDFHCNLRIEENGIFIDVVNNNAFSGENAIFLIVGKSEEWLKIVAPLVTQAFCAVAGAPVKAHEE